ncbi:BrnT family toxin [Acidithiobacillus ferridurans]|uniref:BrnT family toxin n=1 Tax=Acidithiobacillus ferridurans TaxID=1232575 RepID=UPI001C071207|nr:BrnT family toxin [Acidithiobacillus ferridurans]MBU2733887.1 BrnT family toxin [Acidithiobacillus ferridurans]
MKIRFEWDSAKAEANWHKHKVRFEIAARVFADPFAWTAQDRIENGETRQPEREAKL